MAKTNTSNNDKKNSNVTAFGTLPPDKLTQHKLKGNIVSDRVVSRNTKQVKKFVESIKHYRQYVHGVNASKLASPLVNSAHYFTVQMSRADSDNARDRRGLDTANTEDNSVNTPAVNS